MSDSEQCSNIIINIKGTLVADSDNFFNSEQLPKNKSFDDSPPYIPTCWEIIPQIHI